MIDLYQVLFTSLEVAVAATGVVMVAGSPLAYALARPHWSGKTLVDSLVNLPLLLPPSVVGYYLLILLGRGGAGARILDRLGMPTLVFTPVAGVLAAALVSLPLYVQALRNSLSAIDPEYSEAAQVDGATHWQRLRYITLPLARGGLLTGSLLAYARSMGEFGATLIVAGNIPGRTQTLGLAVYTAIQAGDDSLAHLLSLIAIGVGTAVMWVTLRFQQPRS